VFSSKPADELPEVVMEGSQEQNQYSQNPAATTAANTTAAATSSSLPPGITIVPQNPKVIYITVTEPGVTTTVIA
jgi:hypothetical protein